MKTESFVLQAVPFQEYHQLVTLFSKDLGLCKCIIQYGLSKKGAMLGIFAPLNQVEVELRTPLKDLGKIQSASLISCRLELRQSYPILQAALEMLKAILTTQMPHKAAPLLFDLLKSYLDLLPNAISPEVILTSFRLKLLRFEGVLALQPHCLNCNNMIDELVLEEGRSTCKSCSQASPFSKEETDLFLALGLTTSPKLLKELTLSPGFADRVVKLFQELQS